MSHGKLAKGMIDTVTMIAGKFDYLDYYGAYLNEEEDLEKVVNQFISDNSNNELFVITDIFGGSVNNEWMKKIHKSERIHLVAGMNLAFVIELSVLLLDDSSTPEEIIQKAMQQSSENFVYCNQLTLDTTEEEF